MEPLRRPAGADPRLFQIAFLAGFLAWLLAFREFTLAPAAMAAASAAALAVQAVLVRVLRVPERSLLSPSISALSLCLLLRTGSTAVAALAGALAIASKFVLRVGGKHVFNPTNFGIAATILLTGRAWISPGQWGSGPVLAFAVVALGLTVVLRSRRLDVSLAYLGSWAALLALRMLALGERPAVPLHRLSSGAILVFAFFMISDPRSTPDARGARVLFAGLAAALTYLLQFRWFLPGAPVWALFAISPLTPVLDRLWRGGRFEWREKGVPDVLPASA